MLVPFSYLLPPWAWTWVLVSFCKPGWAASETLVEIR